MQNYKLAEKSVYARVNNFMVGRYRHDKSWLKNEHLTFIISLRKKTTRHKTPYFLLCVDGDGKRYYISSLYKINDQCYDFDYRGIKYQICLADGIAEIVKTS